MTYTYEIPNYSINDRTWTELRWDIETLLGFTPPAVEVKPGGGTNMENGEESVYVQTFHITFPQELNEEQKAVLDDLMAKPATWGTHGYPHNYELTMEGELHNAVYKTVAPDIRWRGMHGQKLNIGSHHELSDDELQKLLLAITSLFRKHE